MFVHIILCVITRARTTLLQDLNNTDYSLILTQMQMAQLKKDQHNLKRTNTGS